MEKIKKYLILCLLCLYLPCLSHAQFYLKGYTGYALATGADKLTSYEYLYYRTNSESFYGRQASSHLWKFGQGVNLGLSVGYTLNKNIAFEITANTQLPSTFNYSSLYRLRDMYPPMEEIVSAAGSAGGFFGDLEYTNTMFQVSPQVVFKSNPYYQWTFYLKGGPDFMWATHKKTTKSIAYDIFSIVGTHIHHTPSELYTTDYKGNTGIGLQWSFGTEYQLSKAIAIFAELTSVFMRYTFTNSEILRYEIDGVNSLSQLPSTLSEDIDEHAVFNHTGLNVGIKYIFGN